MFFFFFFFFLQNKIDFKHFKVIMMIIYSTAICSATKRLLQQKYPLTEFLPLYNYKYQIYKVYNWSECSVKSLGIIVIFLSGIIVRFLSYSRLI